MQAPWVRGRGVATALCLLAIVLGGCGGGGASTDRTQIRHVVRAYLRAQARGDGRAACALLAPTGQMELVSVVSTAASGLIVRRMTCPRAIRVLRAIVGAPALSSLVHVRISRIRINGLMARARILDPARRFGPQLIGLQLIGEWRIAGVR
ncbi:MAG TPA: hypothetical protein VE983_07775 [Solirubrobacteraceae bacterium]|nr:hypothetical protein [Solirubrobacteraceae bacterium]